MITKANLAQAQKKLADVKTLRADRAAHRSSRSARAGRVERPGRPASFDGAT